eukprot:CAMPEP_0194765292 /NCGR_PEP_ID=MMETSP0323_2-20130528/25889_1 /TAXON_ID=2866 ORGANISM="Crypthecodinium cohnii, Strain Seligo" /NCGR_SAMPLE_ID=MMETSP0323_2 /ASSEMBLY_ACC=CAM_ASM_000346 /LENGTH=49 /DNA_ID= /DNA_START= /DNA_END= /DNA_ORIENTATION=
MKRCLPDTVRLRLNVTQCVRRCCGISSQAKAKAKVKACTASDFCITCPG